MILYARYLHCNMGNINYCVHFKDEQTAVDLSVAKDPKEAET